VDDSFILRSDIINRCIIHIVATRIVWGISDVTSMQWSCWHWSMLMRKRNSRMKEHIFLINVLETWPFRVPRFIIALAPVSLHRTSADPSAAFVYSVQLVCRHACQRPSRMAILVSVYHSCLVPRAHLMETCPHREDVVGLNARSDCSKV
jgi:hypothetical protein